MWRGRAAGATRTSTTTRLRYIRRFLVTQKCERIYTGSARAIGPAGRSDRGGGDHLAAAALQLPNQAA
jgi:hypothetical protein